MQDGTSIGAKLVDAWGSVRRKAASNRLRTESTVAASLGAGVATDCVGALTKFVYLVQTHQHPTHLLRMTHAPDVLVASAAAALLTGVWFWRKTA